MIDALEQRDDVLRRRTIGLIEHAAERGWIAERLALNQVGAERVENDGIVRPPLQHRRKRCTDQRTLLEAREIGEREINGPGPEPRELPEHALAQLVAVGPFGQDDERGAGEGEARTRRIETQSFERNIGRRQFEHERAEISLLDQFARVRGFFDEGVDALREAIEIGGLVSGRRRGNDRDGSSGCNGGSRSVGSRLAEERKPVAENNINKESDQRRRNEHVHA